MFEAGVQSGKKLFLLLQYSFCRVQTRHLIYIYVYIFLHITLWFIFFNFTLKLPGRPIGPTFRNIGYGSHEEKKCVFEYSYKFSLWKIGCIVAHSRFRGSVNCGAPTMENRFKVTIFYLKSKRLLVFLSGPKWPRGHLGCLYWPQRVF